MNIPTPRDAAPGTERRQQLVSDAMDALDGVESLPVAEQLVRLQEAQGVLAAVLQNSDVSQIGIPGVGQRP